MVALVNLGYVLEMGSATDFDNYATASLVASVVMIVILGGHAKSVVWGWRGLRPEIISGAVRRWVRILTGIIILLTMAGIVLAPHMAPRAQVRKFLDLGAFVMYLEINLWFMFFYWLGEGIVVAPGKKADARTTEQLNRAAGFPSRRK